MNKTFTSSAAYLLFATGSAHFAAAAPTIDLRGEVSHSRVIRGGTTTINTFVGNSAAAGQGDLNYTTKLSYAGNEFDSFSGVRPAGTSGQFDFHPTAINTINLPLGLQTFSITCTDPNATNSPFEVGADIEVISRSRPYVYFPQRSRFYYMPRDQAPAEPLVDPEQFGATGGGESFAASSAAVGGGSNSPTSGLALLSYTTEGASQITTDLTPFSEIPADPDEAHANPHNFNIFTNITIPGTFTKHFILTMRDENIPGGETYTTGFYFTANVVPEPSALALLIGLAWALLPSRRISRSILYRP